MSFSPQIVLIAAMARGGVIGRAGAMPWHLPADLAHFKSVTLGYPVLMGRRTFESIGRALPGRTNIVISRRQPEVPAGVRLAGDLAEAVKLAGEAEQLMVIGGGEIYAEALPLAQRLELTLIDAELEGDTWFPAVDAADWWVHAMTSRPADAANCHPMRFITLERRRGRVAA